MRAHLTAALSALVVGGITKVSWMFR